MMMTPLQSLKRHYGKPYPGRRLVVFLVIILPLMAGIVLWVLNIAKIIPGPWSSVLSAIFTFLSVLFTFLEWYTSTQEQTTHIPQETAQKHLDNAELGLTKRRGALLIWTQKNLSGATVHLYRGFDAVQGPIDLAANIIEVKSAHGKPSFVAILRSLEAGKYTVALYQSSYRTNITISPERATEIDWRRIHIRNSQRTLPTERKF